VKRVIHSHDIAVESQGGAFRVTKDMIVTPLARDYADQHNVKLVYPEELEEEAALVEQVAARVAQVLAARVPGDAAGATAAAAAAAARAPVAGRAVITATGRNQPGVVAAFTAILAEMGVNIADISQTIVGGFFTMIIVAELPEGIAFRAFKERVEQVAQRSGYGVLVMHEALLRAMHRI
jgi:ACT domain-containing protein